MSFAAQSKEINVKAQGRSWLLESGGPTVEAVDESPNSVFSEGKVGVPPS